MAGGMMLAMLSLGVPALGSSASAFEVRVRGQGKLYADVKPAGVTLQLIGSLRDELGNVLPQRNIQVVVRSANSSRSVLEEVVSTDMQGRFQLQRALDEGDYLVTTRFEPTEHLDGASVEREVHLEVIPPRVDIHVPRLVVGQTHPANLRVRASAAGIGVSAPVEVWVNGSKQRVLELDLYGRGAMDVARLLTPGENVIEVRLPSEGRRPEASDASSLRFSQELELEATAAPSQQRLERGLMVSGTVSDADGPVDSGRVEIVFERVGNIPSADQDVAPPVSLVSPKDLHVVVALGESGSFQGFLPGQLIQDGQWRARVSFRPAAGDVLSMVTEVITFDRTGSRWMLNILGLIAILMGCAVLLFRLSTIDFRQLWAKLRAKPSPKVVLRFEEDEPLEVEAIEPEEGAQVAQSHAQIAGVVWDTWRKTHIPFARIELLRDDTVEHTITCMSDGRFRSHELPHGSWQLRVIARGFARGVFELSIPHEGDYRFVRLGMVAIPVKIRRFYQNWVRRVHGEELWGKLSPRQIEAVIQRAFDALPPSPIAPTQRADLKQRLEALLLAQGSSTQLAPQDLLLAVTEIVEESYFSARIYDEELWNMLVSIIQRLDQMARHSDTQEEP